MNLQQWKPLAVRSALALSRTAAGKNDNSWSPDKPLLALPEGDELATMARMNLYRAANHSWERAFLPFSRELVRNFFDDMARRISEGLLKDGQSLYRTWKTEKYVTVSPEQIEEAYAALCDAYADALGRRNDLTEVAAELEKGIALRVHPFADGCGRIARMLGAWTLLRAGQPPAQFASREAYYAAMRGSDWVKKYRAAILQT